MKRKERLRKLLRASVADAVSEVLYYGRKEDENLSTDDVEEMFRKGWVTAEELAAWFDEEVHESAEANMPAAEPHKGEPDAR